MSKFPDTLKKNDWRRLVPYGAAILVFAALTIIYVSPVLEGKRLMQPDIVNWQGMAQEIVEFREETGDEALWTNSMFGGMPAFQISVQWPNNIAGFFHDVMTLWLPRPADMIFLYFAGFFIFLLILGVNPWLSLAGAMGFAFSSYHFIILEAGHNSKAVAIGYMAPVMGAIIYTFRGHLAAGSLLFAVFMGLQLFANHFQITYYLGIIAVLYGLFQLYQHLSEGRSIVFLKKLGVLLPALLVAIGINAGNFWSTYSYTSETMRGGSELTIGDEVRADGLTVDYITNWSYGIGETFTLLIPNAKGGASGLLGNNESAMEHADPAYRSIIARENHYWGNQPFTSGPVYVGAVVLFLFFLSLFYVKGPLKWGLVAAIVLSVVLAWGRNFMPLTAFFIEHVPGYDKFRAVSMTLVIAGFCIPAMAFLGLHHLWRQPGKISIRSKAFLTAAGLTAGLSLIFALAPKLFFSFTSQMESQAYAELMGREPQMAAQIRELLYNLESVRVAIFREDAFRSFFLAAATAIVVALFAKGHLGKGLFVFLLAALIAIDMWPVNRRYLNNDHFAQKRVVERPFPLRTADHFILQDGVEFRVLDLTENTFNSSRTSYFHHSIGGYHGAKLQRYQDLIDHHIMKEIGSIDASLREVTTLDEMHPRLSGLNVLNMFNTRYIIYNPEAAPLQNPHAMGNAWFADTYRLVDNANMEILALNDFDPLLETVVDRRFAHHLDSFEPSPDPGAGITLIHYQPNTLRYAFESESPQLAVFSEVYYPDGWQVTINGEAAAHFRANYLLRAMVLPAGEYEVEFRFEPRSYHAGKYLSLAFSLLLAAALVGGVGYALFRNKKP